MWDAEGVHDLGTLGGPLGSATAANGRGIIVGTCQPLDPVLGTLPPRACVWRDGGVVGLSGLGGPEAWASDVNARGWIVGNSDTAELLLLPHEACAHYS